MIENRIIFEDKNLLVIHKPAGLATQTSKPGEKDLVSEVMNYQHKKGVKEPFAGLINRLDQPVEGIVIFGLTKKATALLSEQLTGGAIEKHYYAGLCGTADVKSATVSDFLIKDNKTNTSRIVDRPGDGAKRALLEYKIIKEKDDISLADIHLITGRHHQIRVQMAGAGLPLLGDRKYGDYDSGSKTEKLGIRNVALCAYKLAFEHPITCEKLEFEIVPEESWYYIF